MNYELRMVFKSFYLSFVLCILSSVSCLIIPASAYKIAGNSGFEGRIFFNSPEYEKQKRNNGSIFISPELYHDTDNFSFTVKPFLRFDSTDNNRTDFDLRELNMFWYNGNLEVNVGLSKVFWGVTESQHLVDVINQTDLSGSSDGEEKLGQPMFVTTYQTQELGAFHFFVLPYFREQIFPGEKGRLRLPLTVAFDSGQYSSAMKKWHTDFAVRYSHTFGDFDIGLSEFIGTGRSPYLALSFDSNLKPVFLPYYYQIKQTGLDFQMVHNEWLWKLETIYVSGDADETFNPIDDDGLALTGGFEYSVDRNLVWGKNLSILLEWLYNEKDNSVNSPYGSDFMIGVRFGLNDLMDTEALFGFIADYENGSKIFTIEASRRISDNLKLGVESYLFFANENDDIGFLRSDNYIQAELLYYF